MENYNIVTRDSIMVTWNSAVYLAAMLMKRYITQGTEDLNVFDAMIADMDNAAKLFPPQYLSVLTAIAHPMCNGVPVQVQNAMANKAVMLAREYFTCKDFDVLAEKTVDQLGEFEEYYLNRSDGGKLYFFEELCRKWLDFAMALEAEAAESEKTAAAAQPATPKKEAKG